MNRSIGVLIFASVIATIGAVPTVAHASVLTKIKAWCAKKVIQSSPVKATTNRFHSVWDDSTQPKLEIPGFDPDVIPPRSLQGVLDFQQLPIQTQLELAAQHNFPLTLMDKKGERLSLTVSDIQPDGRFSANGRWYQAKYFLNQKTTFGIPTPAFASVNPRSAVGLKFKSGRVIEGNVLGFTPDGDMIYFDISRQTYGSIKRDAVTLVDQGANLAGEAPTRKIDLQQSVTQSVAREKTQAVALIGGKEGVFQRKTRNGTIAASTDKGKGEKYNHNEDSIFVEVSDEVTNLGVIDGMGGMGGGQQASEIIADATQKAMSAGKPLESIFDHARKGLREALHKGEINEDSGAVAVVARIQDGRLDMVSIGDSKGVVVRGRKVIAETKDQSKVQSLIDRGEITEAQAMVHPERNLVQGYITESAFVENDGELMTRAASATLKKGDWVVLASDGLWDNATPSEVALALERATDAESARQIIRRLFMTGVNGRPPADDNISIIVYRAA